MLSLRAAITKHIIAWVNRDKAYDPARIIEQRQTFERNMAWLFPTTIRNIRKATLANVPVEIIEPNLTSQRTVVYLHGGGFILGSARSHRQHLKRIAKLCGAQVIAIDYSLAPEAPYPIALDEIQAVYEECITTKQIDLRHCIFMGDSAGGNLALASLLRFRDRHIEMPSCAVLLSPGLDMTLTSKSYLENSAIDPILNHAKLRLFVDSYIGETPRTDPLVSPIFADLNGLPPLHIQVGSDELLLSDSQTIAEHASRDGVDVTLSISDGMWHGWQFFAATIPEARRAMQDVAQFVRRHA